MLEAKGMMNCFLFGHDFVPYGYDKDGVYTILFCMKCGKTISLPEFKKAEP